MKKVFLSLLVVFLCTVSTGLQAKQALKKDSPLVIEVVQIYDPRLPILTDQDMEEILREGERVIRDKFDLKIEFQLHKNPSLTMEEFFRDTSYQENSIYRAMSPYRYDVRLGADMPILKDKGFKNTVIHFLKSMFTLESLKTYFPGKEITSYQEAYEALFQTYHEKVNWLKTLKTADGKPVLLDPLPSYQSFVAWYGRMYEQKSYDIVFANGFILFDLMASPYPHTVCKHVKVGGANFMSPRRKVFDGGTVMVNSLELYGGIPALYPSDARLDRSTCNRMLGGYILAHEFGHAFFKIPDVYDHGDSCLMNSSSTSSNYVLGYTALTNSSGSCPRCRSWIQVKNDLLTADMTEDPAQAGKLYLSCAKRYFDLMGDNIKIAEDYKTYVSKILRKARMDLRKAKDEAAVKECDEYLSRLK